MAPKRVLLVQLPIPPAGLQPIRGNVPLAAGYLILYARLRGLDQQFDFEILPTEVANRRSDQGVARAILEREPSVVGFSCYVWNIERTLWIAERLKRVRPDLTIVIGGPEVTGDNAWVLNHPAVDYAVCGEGEQTFADLLTDIAEHGGPRPGIPGLSIRGRTLGPPAFRTPIPKLDPISSPYLAGILDAADEEMLLLETIRGCIFKCKFCYYPKSYDGLYFVSEEKIIANLRHAAERGAREVVLLDPTLNQRKDFDGFLRLLARCNPDRQWTYFGELRGEGINLETARLLAEANFTEVEVGLQSIEPAAQALMARKNSMKAFERGAQAMLDAGLRVKVDLIIGLPGDTVESVRRGLQYLYDGGLYDDVQIFPLSILPGTAFRQESAELGLIHQPRPPYHVLKTPTFELAEMADLMAEAQELFGCEFDAMPPPKLNFDPTPRAGAPIEWVQLDLDRPEQRVLPTAEDRSQAFALWMTTENWNERAADAEHLIQQIMEDNPHTTLQTVVEPKGGAGSIDPSVLDRLAAAASKHPSYLDKFYAMQPGRARGAKRLVVVAPESDRVHVSEDWLLAIGESADMVWTGSSDLEANASDELFDFEERRSAPVLNAAQPSSPPAS